MNRPAFTAFTFGDRRFDPATGELRLEYALDDLCLVETLHFPVSGARTPDALESALDLLHWVAGVSYWKAACPPETRFEGNEPDPWQAAALARLYREGLAEFAWKNGMDPESWTLFPSAGIADPEPASGTRASSANTLSARALCAIGGGKDSLVALERLRAMGEEVTTFAVGQARLIAEVTETTAIQHLWVRRRLAPELAELNARGAWNGHVPVTAVNAAVGVVLALIKGFDSVVFANERSADEPTFVDEGRTVNHQFAKSFGWERLMDDWVRAYVASNLNCFSLLRRDRELAVSREFAGLEQYHHVFSSCNRHFHLDGPRIASRWCGRCPKCRFVFLALAPFMERRRLLDIFGADLLDDPEQLAGFDALLAFNGVKPFECVGEAAEARAALKTLAENPEWKERAIVRSLAARLQDDESVSLNELLAPSGSHRIPKRFLNQEHEG